MASWSIIFEPYTNLFQKAMGLSKTNYTQARARVLTVLHVRAYIYIYI